MPPWLIVVGIAGLLLYQKVKTVLAPAALAASAVQEIGTGFTFLRGVVTSNPAGAATNPLAPGAAGGPGIGTGQPVGNGTPANTGAGNTLEDPSVESENTPGEVGGETTVLEDDSVQPQDPTDDDAAAPLPQTSDLGLDDDSLV